MPKPFCDFNIQIGTNLVTVRYDFQNRRVCWESGKQSFCYGYEDVIGFREFINERRYASVTSIVNDFQFVFGVRRQRAFWIVESMLSPNWCVQEAVVGPGCVATDGESHPLEQEYSQCFEGLIEHADIFDVFMYYTYVKQLKVLESCGPGKTDYAFRTRRVPFRETSCSTIETDYDKWLKNVFDEIEAMVRGG